MFRVTGRVTRITERSGDKTNEATGEIRSWAMTLYTVLVADQGLVEVSDFSAEPLAAKGDSVDWAVLVSPRGQRLSVSYEDDWDNL